jgi:predicted lysophospholipase L1 biosynthesis ABC-type transport system permease subunit
MVMSVLRLIFAEIRFRTVNFLLSLLAVTVAASLFIVGPTLISGYAEDTDQQMAVLQKETELLQAEAEEMQKETEAMQAETEAMLAEMDTQTTRIMRDLGVNLRIVHKDTNFGSLYTDFVAVDFPEDYVQRLAEAPQIETIVHLVATLQHKLKWRERTVLLMGTLPVLTQSQKNEEKPHMVQSVEPGTVFIGSELGVGLKAGETVEIEGKSFKIAQIMPEFGGLQDVQIVMDLHDAQEVLGTPGRINQIMALNCKCKGNRLSVIRKELEGVLPDTKVTEQTTRAEAREKQRDLVAQTRASELASVQANLERVIANRDRVTENHNRQLASRQRQELMLSGLIGITTPLVVFVSALFVGLMTWINVRERRPEIGVLRALGKNGWNIAALFLGKSFLLGLIGGAVGCGLGYLFTPLIGSATMDIVASLFQVDARLAVATILGAPLVAVMASYLPTLSAISQDPAIVLMDN